MKRFILSLIISIFFITGFSQDIISRNFNNFKLGETVMDSVRNELTKAEYKFKTNTNEITVTKYWFEKYCFDNVTFSFKNNKLSMIKLTQNCFDLNSSDKFGADFLKTLESKYGEFKKNEGIYTLKDNQTLIRLAQQENEDRTCDFCVIIVDLVR